MKPGSPEWAKLVTASKVAAILGVSPWESPRSVWHLMHGDVEAVESNEQQRRGHYLEPAILAWWRDQRGAHILKEQPEYLLGDWAAATPDQLAEVQVGEHEGQAVLVEAKSVAYDDDWGDPGTDAIPAYYLAQCYWQMHVSGVHRCYVPILTSRLRFAEYVIDYDAAIGADLEHRMRAFYDSLAVDHPPPLDDTVATYDAVRKIHKDIDRGESVELTEGEARELVEFQADLKAIEPALRYCKSTVLDRMGRAQWATYDGKRIARRQPRGDDVTFVVVAKPHDLTSPTNQGDAA